MSAQDLPIVQGATRCGYREIDGTSYWVEPTRALTATGEAPPNRLVFWNTGDDLSRRLRPLLPVTPQVEAATAAYVLPRLLKLNTPEVMLPIIGWFFATPLKPRLQQILKHFPFLCVWGTQGSGKTSLIKEIFWPLFGVEDSDLTSVTDTEFTLIRRFSDSESIPACLDEYKIGDMHKTHRSRLHRLLRRVYAGESECRGRTDFSVVRFPLHAPICLCGEMRPSEPALLERIVTACPNKSLREMDPESVRAFAELDREKIDVGLLTRGIIQFLLASDTHSTVALARKALDETLAGQAIAGRVRDNLTAVFCGLIHFEEYAHHLGIELPTLDLGALVKSQCDDIFDGKAGAVKTGCDQFLEQLSDLATTNGIQQFSHYTYTSEGHLALHLGACHMAYAENCRRTSYSGEIIERNMLVRQLQENQRRQGYVLQVSRTVNFRGTKRRAVIIDLERAKQCLDVDDFPKVSEGYYSSASPYSD